MMLEEIEQAAQALTDAVPADQLASALLHTNQLMVMQRGLIDDYHALTGELVEALTFFLIQPGPHMYNAPAILELINGKAGQLQVLWAALKEDKTS